MRFDLDLNYSKLKGTPGFNTKLREMIREDLENLVSRYRLKAFIEHIHISGGFLGYFQIVAILNGETVKVIINLDFQQERDAVSIHRSLIEQVDSKNEKSLLFKISKLDLKAYESFVLNNAYIDKLGKVLEKIGANDSFH